MLPAASGSNLSASENADQLVALIGEITSPVDVAVDARGDVFADDDWTKSVTELPSDRLPTVIFSELSQTSIQQGELFHYSAFVVTRSGRPTGTVTFSVGSVVLCTVLLEYRSNSECSATNAPLGDDAVVATYSGDANYAPTASVAQLNVLAPSS
jgi:hypothetical protein